MNPLVHDGVHVPPKVVTVQLAKSTFVARGAPQSTEAERFTQELKGGTDTERIGESSSSGILQIQCPQRQNKANRHP